MKKTIGIIGPSQIYHLIPVLQEQYEVINLQPIFDKEKNKLIRIIKFIKGLFKIDFLYTVYVSQYDYKKFKLAIFLGKKVLAHWIGSDVRLLLEGETDLTKLNCIDKHAVCFEALQENLLTKGIRADILPITPFNLHFDIAPMPQEHAVIIYMPKGFEMYYGFDEISRVFPKYPTLPFYIVANDDKDKFSDYSNVHVLGRLTKDEMEKLYEKVSIVVRIHVSDGLSMSVLEGMAKGKKVIWNCKYNYAYPGSTTQEICDSLDQILKYEPSPDLKAHDFIVSEYTKENFLKLFNRIAQDL